jgi:hypothetical protein
MPLSALILVVLVVGCAASDESEVCACDTTYECSKDCACDVECNVGSGSDTGSGAPSACTAMCSHVYQTCQFTFGDGNGGELSEPDCVANCAAWLSASEVACLRAAACTEDGLNGCFGNSTLPADTGAYSAACTCTAEPSANGLYGTFCSGTEDGCMGIGLSGELGCFAQRSSGAGTCTYRCSRNDIGYRGECPAGYLCQPGEYLDATDQNWPVCDPM